MPPITLFFAVYDGHGGTQASDYLRQCLHSNVVQHRDFETDIEKAIKEGFIETDRQFMQIFESQTKLHGVGSTAVIALIVTTDSAVTMYTAHVGDSEAVLCRKGVAISMTNSHNLKNLAEKKRIQELGLNILHDKEGKERLSHPVFQGAVMSIAVTRAIGDLYFKLPIYTGGMDSGLLPEPEIIKTQLTTDDQFLILASDGFWDVVTKQEAVDYVLKESKNMDVNQICKGLTDYALKEKILDDTTVLVVKLGSCDEHKK